MNVQNSLNDTSAPIIVTAEDNGKEIRVPAAGTLIVRLDSNRSTGYSWSIVDTPDSLLVMIGQSYQPAHVEPGFVGGGGVDELNFVIAEGAPTDGERAEWLRMEYSPPWSAKEVANTWSIRVVVPAEE
jgi:predicted secreted protein